LGKRPLVRRRGRGGMQYRVSATGKIAPAKYPSFELSENHEAEIIDLVHERGRDVPLAKVRFNDGSTSFIPAVLGAKVGSHIQFGLKSKISDGNVISIQNIPDGTIVCNVEKQFGDGGSFMKSAGTSAGGYGSYSTQSVDSYSTVAISRDLTSGATLSATYSTKDDSLTLKAAVTF